VQEARTTLAQFEVPPCWPLRGRLIAYDLRMLRAARESRLIAVIVIVVALIGASCSSKSASTDDGNANVTARGLATVVTTAAETTTPATTEPAATTTAATTTTSPPPTTTTVAPTTTTTEPAAAFRVAGWVVAENAKTGTTDWRIGADDPKGLIEGYLDTTSVNLGEKVKLFASTAAPEWHVEAYRMGWYHGAGGRLVWTSAAQAAQPQGYATVDQKTGLAEAHWTPSLEIAVAGDWPPGDYLLKLVSSLQGAHYVPLTVRDDRAPAGVLLVNAVTTWQAYNEWGGCSAYKCPFVKGLSRGSLVSFDRPYAHAYNKGSADFLDHELPLVSLVEELGIDAAYATSIDLHRHPDVALKHRAVLSLGHDEYYTAAMRTALVDARDHGVNLGFLGANAMYRQIRLEPSSDGRPERTMANWRSTRDPGAAKDPKLATVEFRSLGMAEHPIVGIGYVCAGVNAAMVLRDTKSWVYAGLDVRDGQALRNLVGNEADRASTEFKSPTNLEILAASPITCGQNASTAHMSYYAAPSGAGVFAVGTIWWICALDGQICSRPENVPVVRGITINVLKAFVAGPAGTAHPSTANART